MLEICGEPKCIMLQVPPKPGPTLCYAHLICDASEVSGYVLPLSPTAMEQHKSVTKLENAEMFVLWNPAPGLRYCHCSTSSTLVLDAVPFVMPRIMWNIH